MRPVSLRSTMRTLPKAPLPTTRSSRKWLRFTVVVVSAGSSTPCWLGHGAWQVQVQVQMGRWHT